MHSEWNTSWNISLLFSYSSFVFIFIFPSLHIDIIRILNEEKNFPCMLPTHILQENTDSFPFSLHIYKILAFHLSAIGMFHFQ